MCLNGIGVLLYNGVQGIAYYTGRAGRLIISNGGTIATVAVVGRYYPTQALAALGGVVLSRGASWITQQMDARYNVHVADLLDGALNHVPRSVSSGYFNTVRTLATPQRQMTSSVLNNPQLHWINDNYIYELIAPVLEEGIYRLGIQQGMAFALVRFGVPSAAAHVFSNLIAAHLFAGGHNPDPTSPEFRNNVVAGIAFGVMMSASGAPAAVLTHSLHNFSLRLTER